MATSNTQLTIGYWIIGGSFYFNYGKESGVRLYVKTASQSHTFISSVAGQAFTGTGVTMTFIRPFILNSESTNYINQQVIWTLQRESGSFAGATSHDPAIAYGYLIKLK